MNAPSFLTRDLPVTRWIDRGANAWLLVAALWLECALVLLIRYWSYLGPLDFNDPDDALRLVQVRDFLAGQSWFDVSQHRVNPPTGGPMHWSRLLDLPIAAFILLLRPLLGLPMAEIVACAAVPLLLMGGLCAVMFATLRPLLGNGRAVLAVVLLITSFSILAQMTPLRIDHHGWQILMAALLVGGMLHREARTGGLMAGTAMALWLHISSEGLPFAALAGAVLALRYSSRAEEWPRLLAYIWSASLGSVALLLLTKGLAASLVSYCDAMSPVYLVPLVVVAPIMQFARHVLGNDTAFQRLAAPGIAGAAAAMLFLWEAGQCLAGPFSTLDPLVYAFWYKGVLEGLPIWEQEPVLRGIILLPGLAGIIGTALALRDARNARERMNWLSLLLLSLGGLAVALMVMRSMSFAHLFALPGCTWMIAALYSRSRALRSMPLRVLCILPLCALTPAGLATAATLMVPSSSAPEASAPATGREDPTPAKVPCVQPAQLAALAHFPRTTFFAPIDMGPDILVKTPHSVIGTGHHRNVVGMAKVIRAYLSTDRVARTIVLSTQARYLLVCPGLNETDRYVKARPGGLMAQLRQGRHPAWLRPVHVPGVTSMRIYAIRR